MLRLDDSRWAALTGGYGVPYDPRPALERLTKSWNDEAAWRELWNELHHQGDLGEASYAALVALTDIAKGARTRGWQFYSLVATIESERHALRNPPVPDWLRGDYGSAWTELLRLALEELHDADDPLVIQSALAVVALSKGATKLGVMIARLDESELDAMLEESLAWSEDYRDEPDAPAS